MTHRKVCKNNLALRQATLKGYVIPEEQDQRIFTVKRLKTCKSKYGESLMQLSFIEPWVNSINIHDMGSLGMVVNYYCE